MATIEEAGHSDIVPAMWRNGKNRPKVVTVLEILSPWNKGLRGEVLNSCTNLVEIDLLRAERGFVNKPADYYHILVSAAAMRPRAHSYPFTVSQPIPAFHLPLQADDEWPVLDLNTILHELYDRAGYDMRINYRSEPIPPFEGDAAIWVDTVLRDAELR